MLNLVVMRVTAAAGMEWFAFVARCNGTKARDECELYT